MPRGEDWLERWPKLTELNKMSNEACLHMSHPKNIIMGQQKNGLRGGAPLQPCLTKWPTRHTPHMPQPAKIKGVVTWKLCE